jgi:hypothetical protein
MNSRTPHPAAVSAEDPRHPQHPRRTAAFRTVRLLVGGYLGISVLTLAAIVLLRHHPTLVNSAVRIRGTIVVASALLMYLSALRAAHGSPRAYRRLRIISGVMVLAIAAIITLPGTFPLWMKAEQAACGLLLIAVAAIVNSKPVRTSFPKA